MQHFLSISDHEQTLAFSAGATSRGLASLRDNELPGTCSHRSDQLGRTQSSLCLLLVVVLVALGLLSRLSLCNSKVARGGSKGLQAGLQAARASERKETLQLCGRKLPARAKLL